MCTVSYLPKDAGFIITSNRDEAPERGVFDVDQKKIGNVSVTFPKDPAAGGSWFVVGDNGAVACLLNGAFEPYDRSIPFEKSRGQVLLDAFRYRTADELAASGDYAEAAPFTLVIRKDDEFSQLIWDGQNIVTMALDPVNPHFWSSVTLYPPDVRQWRRELFDNWLNAHNDFRQDDIIDFHRYGGHGDAKNDFVMNRNDEVKTLSITSAESRKDELIFRHINLNDIDNPFRQNLTKSHSVANGS